MLGHTDWIDPVTTLALTSAEIGALVVLACCVVVVFYLKIKGELPSDPGGSV